MTPAGKSYRVSGPHRVHGHDPGETFKARFSREHEQYLIRAGHIALAKTEPKSDGSAS